MGLMTIRGNASAGRNCAVLQLPLLKKALAAMKQSWHAELAEYGRDDKVGM